MAYVSALQGRLEKAKENLQNVDENIRKLTGREPGERRIPGVVDRSRDRDQRRVSLGGQGQRGRGRGGGVQRGDAFQRLGLPLARRQSTGSAFSRLGSRVDGPQPKRPRRKQSDDEEDLPKHTIQSSVVATPKIERTRQDSIKEQSKDEQGQKRNRRMFGHLLGTLQKFKQESNSLESKESRRIEIEHKLDVQAQEEKQAVALERKQLFIKRSNQQAELQKLEKLVDMAKEQDVWDAHSKRLSQFIRTKAKPPIFYRPAKPSLVTEKKLKDTKELMNEMMRKRRAEIEEEIHQLQDEEEHDGKEMDHDGKEWEVKGKTKEKKRRHSKGKHEESERRNGKHSKKQAVSDDGELPTSDQQDSDDDADEKETGEGNKNPEISMDAEKEWVVKEGSAGKGGEVKQALNSSSEEGEVDRTTDVEAARPEEGSVGMEGDEGKENKDEKEAESEDFRSALYKEEEFDQRNELSWEEEPMEQ